ncbi:hypothetical protein HGRIS_011722 [Hohenbuehelia grisea]|uniref:BTB domain-containing protein n=1 Tax=Hohenbuehelia grisea TaxID=104357 RepID=A0ABR3JY64_9AGAR
MPLEFEILQRQTDTGPSELRVDPTLWFAGGTVVFAAPVDISSGSADLIHFKVHRDILCMHSPIFQDMFSVPTPAQNEEMDGVPFVLLPDNGPDVQSFLRFIYIPTYEPRGLFEADYALKMAGALKLAMKYEAVEFAKHILDHLKEMWPADIKSWDRRYAVIKEAFDKEINEAWEAGFTGEPDDPMPEFINLRPDTVIAMIWGARCEDLAEFRSVLAIAYYDLACHPLRFTDALHEYLSTRDLQRVIRGRQNSLDKLLELIKIDSASAGMVTHRAATNVRCNDADCKIGRDIFWNHFWSGLCRSSDYVEFLADAKRRMETTRDGPKSCWSCACGIKAALEYARSELFSLLSELYLDM